MTNRYCEFLGIDVPSLEEVEDLREANADSLLIVALLERGDAKALSEAAERFRADGRWEIGEGSGALFSARKAVRARVETARRWVAMRPDPASKDVPGQ